MNDEFGIYYRPELAAGRVVQTRRQLLWRVGSTLVVVAIGIGLRLGYPEEFGSSALWFIGSALVIGLAFASRDIAQFLAARTDAKRVAPCLALGANREGILLGPDWFGWGEVGALMVRPGRWGGSSRLVATGRDHRAQEILLDYTDVMPATLDSAIVALSGGRARIDLSRLDA
ncbi:MAG: hypothetical protein LCH76_06255 [Actinobacteria bacterium]|nr:hypothetical protein [Actinomycetota bacterium]